MNRMLVSILAGFTLAAAPHRPLQGPPPALAQMRIAAPMPRPSSPIAGLRLAWSIDPASVALDRSYTTAALAPNAPIGANGFPVAHVPIRIVLRMHNDTTSPIDVGDGGGYEQGWGLTLNGPGAVSLENRSPCRFEEIERLPRVVRVPAHGDAEIVLTGLTSGASCTTRAWFYTAPGHYVVTGSLRTHYVVGGVAPNTDLDRGQVAVLPIPALAFDVTR